MTVVEMLIGALLGSSLGFLVLIVLEWSDEKRRTRRDVECDECGDNYFYQRTHNHPMRCLRCGRRLSDQGSAE